MKVNQCGDNSPNEIKENVIPEISFECATDYECCCPREVHDIKDGTLERDYVVHRKAVGAQNCEGSIPINKI